MEKTNINETAITETKQFALVATNRESVVRYDANGQEIELDFNTIKDLIAIGDTNVSDKDVLVFMNKCKFNGLNPFLNEAYLIKFGTTVQMVTGKETFGKRSELDHRYKGYKAGIVVADSNKKIVHREGSIYLKGHEMLLGGWCEVYKEGQENVRAEILLTEYSTGKSSWLTKPALMIRKCAYVAAHREAFPNLLSDIFIPEEMEKSGMIIAEKAPASDEQINEAMEALRDKKESAVMDKINRIEQVEIKERQKITTVTVCESDEFEGKYRCRACGSMRIEKNMKQCPNYECSVKLIWVD